MSVYQRLCPADHKGVLPHFFQAPFTVKAAPVGAPSRFFSSLFSSALDTVPFQVGARSPSGFMARDRQPISACHSPQETHAAFETVFEETMQRYLEESA
ncbi:MAG: hypothetical protein AAF371_03285 [Pseudomonadota bacterium]